MTSLISSHHLQHIVHINLSRVQDCTCAWSSSFCIRACTPFILHTIHIWCPFPLFTQSTFGAPFHSSFKSYLMPNSLFTPSYLIPIPLFTPLIFDAHPILHSFRIWFPSHSSHHSCDSHLTCYTTHMWCFISLVTPLIFDASSHLSHHSNLMPIPFFTPLKFDAHPILHSSHIWCPISLVRPLVFDAHRTLHTIHMWLPSHSSYHPYSMPIPFFIPLIWCPIPFIFDYHPILHTTHIRCQSHSSYHSFDALSHSSHHHICSSHPFFTPRRLFLLIHYWIYH